MPVHEYYCPQCGYKIEILTYYVDSYTTTIEPRFCPTCQEPLHKKFGNIAHFEFKGALA